MQILIQGNGPLVYCSSTWWHHSFEVKSQIEEDFFMMFRNHPLLSHLYPNKGDWRTEEHRDKCPRFFKKSPSTKVMVQNQLESLIFHQKPLNLFILPCKPFRDVHLDLGQVATARFQAYYQWSSNIEEGRLQEDALIDTIKDCSPRSTWSYFQRISPHIKWCYFYNNFRCKDWGIITYNT